MDGGITAPAADAPLIDPEGERSRTVAAEGNPIGARSAQAGERRGERRFRALLEYASDMIVVLDRSGAVDYASPSVERTLGHRPLGWGRDDLVSRIHPADRLRVRRSVTATYARPGVRRPLAVRYRHADGSWRYLEVVADNRLDDPAVGGVVLTARDLTEQRSLRERLARQGHYDAVTALPTRKLFAERVTDALLAARGSRRGIAVILLAVDGIKPISETAGEDLSDAVLAAVGRQLVDCLRPADFLARYGDGTFAVMVERLGRSSDAVRVAERLLAAVQQPCRVGPHDLALSASLGIAHSRPGTDGAADLLRDAEAALSHARLNGAAHAAVFSAGMRAAQDRRRDLVADLWGATQRGELQLVYQPEVDLHTGVISGAEALVRWRHPRHGRLLPGEFIPMAETTGLILPIGQWVLERACRDARRWRAIQPGDQCPIVSVNLSAIQLRQPTLAAQVADTLAEAGFAPSALSLELTESVLLEDDPAIRRQLEALRALGIRLAIDDFGTGYSSLSYLQRLPVNILKVDRSFVAQLGRDRKATAIVRGIAQLGHALGLAVIAEGIETAEQLEWVRSAGCDRAQGFYFSRPVPAEVLERAGFLPGFDAAASLADGRGHP